MARNKNAWTDLEEEKLRAQWGWRPVKKIATSIGRSETAIFAKARKLRLRQQLPDGCYTMTDAVKISGYSDNQIRRAVRRLGIRLRRSYPTKPGRRGNRVLITKAQLKEVTKYLDPVLGLRVVGRSWGENGRPPCCIECGTTEEPHFAKRRCENCYRRGFEKRKRRNMAAVARRKGYEEGVRAAIGLAYKWSGERLSPEGKVIRGNTHAVFREFIQALHAEIQ